MLHDFILLANWSTVRAFILSYCFSLASACSHSVELWSYGAVSAHVIILPKSSVVLPCKNVFTFTFCPFGSSFWVSTTSSFVISSSLNLSVSHPNSDGVAFACRSSSGAGSSILFTFTLFCTTTSFWLSVSTGVVVFSGNCLTLREVSILFPLVCSSLGSSLIGNPAIAPVHTWAFNLHCFSLSAK